MLLEATSCLFHVIAGFQIAGKTGEERKEKNISPSPRDLQPSQLETINRRQGNGTVFDSALLCCIASWVHLVLGFQGWCKSGCASVWGC